MLGSIIKPRPWKWAVIGKHPAANDYIQIGDPSALIEAVADWAAKGFQRLCPDGAPAQGLHSWRFWLQGVNKGEILCGLGRDSSDRIGRPYPLLVLGEGTLKGWEKKWTQLPLRLESTWRRMEHVAARRFDHIHDMEAALAGLRPPETTEEDSPEVGEDENASECNMDQFRRQMADDGFGMVHLNHSRRSDPERTVRQCHGHLQAYCRQMPRGVFVGGNPQKTYLAATEHPLNKADFVRLWTV